MVETYKHKSRMWTIIVAVIVAISTIGINDWQNILPTKYSFLAPTIVAVLGFVVAQLTEEKRVNVAEQLVHEEYAQEPSETVEFGSELGA